MKTNNSFLPYPNSVETIEGTSYCLVSSDAGYEKVLCVSGDTHGFSDEQGLVSIGNTDTEPAHAYPLTEQNAAELRTRIPWLNPQPLGMQRSAGFGDRLGLATPGHVLALRAVSTPLASIAPIFAQQSVRENVRTHRTPQQVLDDATWGVFQTGWRLPWGADADHLKTTDDIDSFLDAGFSFFTIDPGDYVDDAAQTDPLRTLQEKVRGLPWDQLPSSLEETRQQYLGNALTIEDFPLSFDEETFLRAMAKYGRAIAHTAAMARHLEARAGSNGCDLEVSVDETATPTSPEEHFLIANELRRSGVRWTSLAPRFVGKFEKGVDYIGDLTQFEETYARHAAIARFFGNYRLSLHSGSDKFSIYAIAARLSQGLLHLKTAGTSYLEGLRVIAQVNPQLFREIFNLACQRYETDRVSYHVSANKSNLPNPLDLPDTQLEALLDQFDARQIFHVTFGITLERFGLPLMQTLKDHEIPYEQALERHFRRHLEPLIQY